MTRPDFFIVGAPKCATTALSTYLGSHPEVFFSNPKEPFFFGTDLEHGLRACSSPAQYLRLFTSAQGYKRIGEGSVWYLFSRTAAPEIHSFNPKARIVVMLRNPVDMLHSLHGHFVFSANEDLLDFDAALAAQDERRRGRQIPKRAFFPAGLQYLDVARFHDQVKRYLDLFCRDRVHVILFDDFSNDTNAAYAAVLEFLEVSTDHTLDFEPINQGRVVRNATLRRLALHPPIRLSRLDRFLPSESLRQRSAQLRARVRHQVDNWTARPAPRPAMNFQTRASLARELQPDVEKLSRLLDRDLTYWCRP